MYPRTLDIGSLAARKSIFLFGPRSTGKSTLLRQAFPPEAIINLLRSQTWLSLSAKPSMLREMVAEISRTGSVVVIDEIQKLPQLLDEVHDLIETTGMHFVMTGSSARKLKASGVNLLAGRAWQARMFPLTSQEIPGFNLERYLLYGGLPQVCTSQDPQEELSAYVYTYLEEEIKAEALVHRIGHFSRFLKTASLANTEQVNFANMSRDTGVPVSSVRAWFDILNDTFLGFLLEPWKHGQKRKAVSSAKFYFFDTGVANYIAGFDTLHRDSSEFGKSFEHFIAMELRAFLDYRRLRHELCYWRSSTGLEVDFVVGSELAIEVKASQRVDTKDLKGLRAIKEEGSLLQCILVSFDEANRETTEGIRLLHWQRFLSLLWTGAIL